MSSVIYNIARTNLANGSVNYITDNINLVLTYNYTPDVVNHTNFGQVSQYEIIGIGYTNGGVSLNNKSIVQDNSTNRAYFKADDINWENTTINVNGAIIYKVGDNNDDSPLIAYLDFSTIFQTHQQNFIIQWDSIEGVFHLR